MNKKIELSEVSLISITSIHVRETIKALQYSMKGINFGDVILITHKKPLNLPSEIRYEHIEKLDNIDKYNKALVYDIHRYVKTEFALIIHYDGYVVNPQMWKSYFLNYDYIGSPWIGEPVDGRKPFRDEAGDIYRVGNGVSLRSKRLMELPEREHMKWEPYCGWFNEDGYKCVKNRKMFEEKGMKFAPVTVAVEFGREFPVPEGCGIEPFLFHKWYGENSKYPRLSWKGRLKRFFV